MAFMLYHSRRSHRFASIAIGYSSRARRDRDAALMLDGGCTLRLSHRPSVRQYMIHVHNDDAFSLHMAKHGPVDRRRA